MEPTLAQLTALGAALFVKHFLADGPLQTPYQIVHKGIWFHPGGLLHSGIHAGLTTVCLIVWCALLGIGALPVLISAVAVGEFAIHYVTDLAKKRIDDHRKWSTPGFASGGERELVIHDPAAYFALFLADQMIHSLTYVAIVYTVGASLATRA